MTEISITEARARWPEVIRRVQNGEEFIITRRGQPVARLLPVAQKKTAPTRGE